MKEERLREESQPLKVHYFKRKWQMAVAILAAVVVFCTTYALILPAATMEKQEKELVCPISVHQHTEGCYQEVSTEDGGTERVLTCGQADYVVHVHNADCLDSDGNLVCPLPQIEAHQHSDACYESHQVLVCSETENEGHVHDTECYTREQGELICEDVSEEHVHTDECYNWTDILNCGMEEGQGAHQHTEDCYQTETVQTCGAQELHMHSNTCYDGNGALICGQLELTEHIHGDGCFQVIESTESTEESVPPQKTARAGQEPVRLMQYASDHGGEVEITISNNNVILDPGSNGEYEVMAGETYNVRVAYYCESGLEAGRYYVTFASNIDLAQRGKLVLIDNAGKEIEAGDWYFEQKDDGVVWLIFDVKDTIQHHSNVDLIADVTCKFDYVDKPVEFDGGIKVNIKQNEDTSETEVSKWAKVWDSNRPGKIDWRVNIQGNSASQIVGSVITDAVTSGNHYYTEEDMADGIQFEATHSGESHYWTVREGDNGLTWEEDRWSYTMPESITCEKCGQTIQLGDDDWLYYLKYTSTVKPDSTEGYNRYENKVSVDGFEATGKIQSGAAGSSAKIVKKGRYNHGSDSDEDKYADDTIQWTITATIPGIEEGGKYDYFWHLWDSMKVIHGEMADRYRNDLDKAVVTATIGGRTISVPEKERATDGDQIYWECSYSAESSEGSGVWYGREIDLYSRCTCTEQTCADWDGESHTCKGKNSKGFCLCWCFDQEVTLNFTYETAAQNLVKNYGGLGAEISNNVDLDNQQKLSNGEWANVNIDSSKVNVPIPGVFDKQLMEEPGENNGFLAEYRITVNEAMADLSSLQELTINDTMTKTLGFLSATLKIQAENSDGQTWYLEEGTDYTIEYDTEAKDSENKDVNRLTITLNKPALGPYRYTLIYDTSVRGGGGLGTSYGNAATVELFGKTYDVGGSSLEVPKAVITGETYGATLYKYDEEDINKPLKGAVFGLYTEDGTLMKTYTTGNDGVVQVETHPASGVVLHVHVPYYLQELEAPEGYELDSKKHYFWFCNNKDTTNCSKANVYGMPPYNGTCVYTFQTDEKTHDLEISNKVIPDSYELPDTGGPGTLLYTFGGVLLTGGTLMYFIYRRRRKTVI